LIHAPWIFEGLLQELPLELLLQREAGLHLRLMADQAKQAMQPLRPVVPASL
jgi:hypothetical protein